MVDRMSLDKTMSAFILTTADCLTCIKAILTIVYGMLAFASVQVVHGSTYITYKHVNWQILLTKLQLLCY